MLAYQFLEPKGLSKQRINKLREYGVPEERILEISNLKIERNRLNLTEVEWRLLQAETKPVLLFAGATEKFESRLEATFCDVLPVLVSIVKKLEGFNTAFSLKIKEILLDYLDMNAMVIIVFSFYHFLLEKLQPYYLATFLNPTSKNFRFYSQDRQREIQKFVFDWAKKKMNHQAI